MSKQHQASRWVRRVLLATGVTAVAGWLLFQYIPQWYQPLELSYDQTRTVQRQLEQTFENVTQQMAEGASFSITCTRRQLNEMLAAQLDLWPGMSSGFASNGNTPVILIDPPGILIGIRCRNHGIATILNARLTPRIQSDAVEVNVDHARAGSLPIPRSLLIQRFDWLLRGEDLSEPTENLQNDVNCTEDGFRIHNRFVWPNGKIVFHLTAIHLNAEELTLEIQPEKPIPGLRD